MISCLLVRLARPVRTVEAEFMGCDYNFRVEYAPGRSSHLAA